MKSFYYQLYFEKKKKREIELNQDLYNKGYYVVKPFFVVHDFNGDELTKKNNLLIKKKKQKEIIFKDSKILKEFIENWPKNKNYLIDFSQFYQIERKPDYRFIDLFDFLILYSVEFVLYNMPSRFDGIIDNKMIIELIIDKYKNNILSKKQFIYLVYNLSDYPNFFTEKDLAFLITFLEKNNLNIFKAFSPECINRWHNLFVNYIDKTNIDLNYFLLNMKELHHYNSIIEMIFKDSKNYHFDKFNDYQLFLFCFVADYNSELFNWVDLQDFISKKDNIKIIYYLITAYLHDNDEDNQSYYLFLSRLLSEYKFQGKNEKKYFIKNLIKISNKLKKILLLLEKKEGTETIKINQFLAVRKKTNYPQNFEILLHNNKNIKAILEIIERNKNYHLIDRKVIRHNHKINKI